MCSSPATSIEGPRSGGKALREGAPSANAMLAVSLAREGHVGGETVLEGEAGFYHAYTGNNKGVLAYSFEGKRKADLGAIARDLGKSWTFLETLYRIYSIPGYHLAPIDLTAGLCQRHDIKPADIDRIEAVVNWYETQYPAPPPGAPRRRTA